jgi:hypothetical protein
MSKLSNSNAAGIRLIANRAKSNLQKNILIDFLELLNPTQETLYFYVSCSDLHF